MADDDGEISVLVLSLSQQTFLHPVTGLIIETENTTGYYPHTSKVKLIT